MSITAAADDILIFFFVCVCAFFLEKIRLDITCKLSAKQTIHMKCQVVFSLKTNKKNRMPSSTVLLSALRSRLALCT